jgi:hypothetical protein
MTTDAGRQRRRHHPPVRHQPALAAKANHVRAQHEILQDVILVTLEARAGWPVDHRQDAILVDRPALARPALGAAIVGILPRLQLGARLQTTRLELRSALQTLELGDRRAQLSDRLLELGVLRQQPLGQSLKLTARKI